MSKITCFTVPQEAQVGAFVALPAICIVTKVIKIMGNSWSYIAWITEVLLYILRAVWYIEMKSTEVQNLQRKLDELMCVMHIASETKVLSLP